MMTSAELVAAVDGTLLLLAGNRQAMTRFDCSAAGFWRSFALILTALPVILLLAPWTGPDAGRLTGYLAGTIVVNALAWLAFPILMIALARPFGLTRTYVPFIVARNWGSLLGSVPQVFGALLYACGVVGMAGVADATFVSIGLGLFLAWRTARIAGEAPAGLAAGLVALELVLTLVVAEAAHSLIG